MIKRIYVIMLVSFLVVGCIKSELDDVTTQSGGLSDQITFGLGANWTRGANIESTDDIPSLTVYSYYADYSTTAQGVTSWDDITSDDLLSFFTSDINTPFTLTNEGYGASESTVWSYTGGTRYWPMNDYEKLSFIAIYPNEELTFTPNEDTGKPELYYTQSEFSGDNDDVVYAAYFDKTLNDFEDGVVNFDLNHILTKLTLKAMLEGTCQDDIDYYTDVEYTINGVTIYGLYANAELEINSDGTTTWVIDESKATMDITGTQGVTFLGIDDAAAVLNGDEYTDIMATATDTTKDQAIFVIPQKLGDNRDVAPTVKVRIRKSFKDQGVEKELIYETLEIEIPASDDDLDWKAGTHYALSFIFDIGNLSKYATPLTITSAIYDWTETTVDVDVHPNTYMYASTDLFEVGVDETYADMIICTNYEYDLRRHRRKYELDGENYTESAGFTYYLVDNTSINPDTWGELLRLEPVLLWDDDFTSGSNYEYEKLKEYNFAYKDDGTLYLTDGTTEVTIELDGDGYADVEQFEDSEGWMYFAIIPSADDSSKNFYYKVKKTTRKEEGLYTNTSVDDDYSYGINKKEDDAVYTLRLNINKEHLDTDAEDGYGYFYGKIGAEAISNGGGLVTTKFRVTLKKEL